MTISAYWAFFHHAYIYQSILLAGRRGSSDALEMAMLRIGSERHVIIKATIECSTTLLHFIPCHLSTYCTYVRNSLGQSDHPRPVHWSVVAVSAISTSQTTLPCQSLSGRSR